MPPLPPINEIHLEAICEVLGGTKDGLTGSEIGKHLKACGIYDVDPSITKRTRIFYALSARQRQDGCANNVLSFIQRVTNPALYHRIPGYYEEFRARINTALSFAGYHVNESGEIRSIPPAKTLGEAEQRAHRLQNELRRRQVHPDVINFCKAELLQDNYFHAVLEATKSLSEKIRQKSGLTGDAGELAQKAFGLGQAGVPYLAFNALTNDTQKSEQSGLTNLFVGTFGAFRNPTAHGPKIFSNMTEQDALDLLTLVSFLHRRLDSSVPTGRK